MKGALIEIAGGEILAVGVLPFTHVLPDGGTALLEEVGQEVPAHDTLYRVSEYVEAAFDRPGPYYTQGADVETRDGDTITVTRQWTAWTQQEIDTYQAAQRDHTATRLDDTDDILRAVVLLLMDEFNLHAARHQAILQAAETASSLATFKTAMAAINVIPQRTAAQLKTAIREKLGT